MNLSSSLFYKPIVNLRMIWDRSKHVVIYNKQNFVVFGKKLISFLWIAVRTGNNAHIHEVGLLQSLQALLQEVC